MPVTTNGTYSAISLADNTDADMLYEFGDPLADVKLREMVLYIADRCKSHEKFGMVKLYKMLFYSDVESYGRTGCPISGTRYVKLPMGPGPELAHFEALLTGMVRGGDITIEIRPIVNFAQKRVVPVNEYKRNNLTIENHKTIDRFVEYFKSATAERVSEISHGLAWRTTPDYKSIPYNAIFLSNDPISEDELASLTPNIVAGLAYA